MKTDWSQMNGIWVSMQKREPPCPGEYFVTTTSLREHNMKWDGCHWDLKHKNDWVVWWLDTLTDPETGKQKKMELI